MIHGIDTGFLVAAEVLEHPNHLSARQCFFELRAAGDSFAWGPQVLAEFIQVRRESPPSLPRILPTSGIWEDFR
jgi:hypothetical protein